MIRLLLIVTMISAMLLMACGDDSDDASPDPNGNGSVTQPSGTEGEETLAGGGTTPEPAPETPIANVCLANPAPGTPQTIQVDSPAPLTKHRGEVTVTGKIAAFEATFKIRIFDASGGVISGATGMSAEGQVLSPFSVEVPAAVVTEQLACIWVYEESAQDGSPINVAQVPVVIQA
jgi:hypothetical protein